MNVATILPIAEISQYMASNAIDNGGLYGGGEDLSLPRKLYCIRKNVEWLYDLSPSDDTLFATSRYLYALCGKYKFKAASIMGTGGSVVPIIPDDVDCAAGVPITAADFEASDGKTVYRPDWDGKALLIFWNNINRFILQPEFQYVAGGGFKILQPTDFDARTTNSDAIFIVFVGCTSAGALFMPNAFPINEFLIYPAGQADPFVFTWTAYYKNKYGVGSFDLNIDYGDGVFQPSGIQGVADDASNPSTYSFTGHGGNRFQLVFK